MLVLNQLKTKHFMTSFMTIYGDRPKASQKFYLLINCAIKI